MAGGIVGPSQPIGSLASISKSQSSTAEEAVILIPGLNSVKLSSELYEWKPFWETWCKKNINEKYKYKFFVFRYDGWDSVKNSAELLSLGISQLLEKEKNIKRISFIGYSQGGVIARIIISEKPQIDALTRKVITLAAGHQGTPIMSPPLLYKLFSQQNPAISLRNNLIFKFLRGRYRYAYAEEAWTDFDSELKKSIGYIPSDLALRIPTPSKESLNKFIVYASYFYTYYSPDLEGQLEYLFQESLPKNLLASSKAGQLELNRQMIIGMSGFYKNPAKRTYFTRNDGVFPVVSALWGRQCIAGEESPTEWARFFSGLNELCPTVKNYRVFYGMTHLMWRKPLNKKLSDLMHPELEKKHLYDWIIDDLTAQ